MQTPSRLQTRFEFTLRAIASLCLGLYPALLGLMNENRVPGKAILLLALIGLVMLAYAPRRLASALTREDRAPLAAMLAFCLAHIALYTIWHAHTAVDTAIRLVIALLMLPLVRLLRPTPNLWVAGCVVGAIGLGMLSVWQVTGEGLSRAEGIAAPNMNAAYGLLLGLLPWLMSPSDWEHGLRRIVLWLGVLGGTITMVLSGSRMAWLAAVILIVWRWHTLSRRRVLQIGAIIVLAALASLLIPVGAGRHAGMDDLVRYAHGDVVTSLGMRLDMWRAGAMAAISHPLAGVGPDAFQQWLIDGAARGDWQHGVVEHNHAHDELLHALATGGLLELIPLLAVWLTQWRLSPPTNRATTPRNVAPHGRAAPGCSPCCCLG